MIVRMRPPSQPPLTTKLRDANRALHRPEVWVGKWDINGMKLRRMLQLPPFVAIMLVAVGNPVARRNSAMIFREQRVTPRDATGLPTRKSSAWKRSFSGQQRMIHDVKHSFLSRSPWTLITSPSAPALGECATHDPKINAASLALWHLIHRSIIMANQRRPNDDPDSAGQSVYIQQISTVSNPDPDSGQET